MTRKEKKARKKLHSTRQLMGIDQFTEYGLKVGKSELVFFLIQPNNLSVLSEEGIRGRVRALTELLHSTESVRMLAVDSRESFQRNKDWYSRRSAQEELPAVRELLVRTPRTWTTSRPPPPRRGHSRWCLSWTGREKKISAVRFHAWKRASGTGASMSAAPGSRTLCGCWPSTMPTM